MEHLERERDYRARTFNFGGFALMTPLGHLIMDPATLFSQLGLYKFIFYSLFCFFLFFLGLCLLEIGRDILFHRR